MKILPNGKIRFEIDLEPAIEKKIREIAEKDGRKRKPFIERLCLLEIERDKRRR